MTTFPQTVLDLAVELNLNGWTDITDYAYQREGASPAVQIGHGRANEQATASPGTVAMQWNNRDGRFSPRNPTAPYYGLLGRNTPLRVSVPAASNYLRFADDAVSYASCPSTLGLRMASDIDVRLDMDLDNWQPCFLAGQWGPSDANWALSLNGDGTAAFTWYDGTSVNQAASTMPVSLGRVAVRAYFDPAGSSGSPQVIFYTAPTMAGSWTQLGNAVAITSADYAHAGTVVTAVGYSAGWENGVAGLPGTWASGTGQDGLQGAVYELQVYSALSLEADPVFSSQTAGAASFTDAQSNTWTLSGSAAISSRNYRVHAECTTLPQQWDATGTDVWTPVAAAGILRRLQQNSAPLMSALRRAVLQLAGLAAYWPCEDVKGSTHFASALPGGQPMHFTGSPGFTAAAGSPQSPDTEFPCSAQLPTLNGSAWYGPVPWPAPPPAVVVRCAAFMPSSDYNGGVLLTVIAAGALLQVIEGGPVGAVQITGLTATGAAIATAAITVTGLPALISLELTVSGGTVTAALRVLEAGQASPQSVTTTYTGTLSGASGVIVNNYGYMTTSETGHVWAQSQVTPLAALADPLNAWQGETAANRFGRLCAENSIPARVYGYPDLSMPMGYQPIDTLANNLQYCEDAGRGLVYEPREALAIGYRTLGSLCSQSPALTLDYSQKVFDSGGGGLVPQDDDQFTVNDVTATRSGGSSARVQVTTGPMSINAPPSGVGDYQSEVTLYNAWDKDLANIAGWMTWIGTDNTERYPVIPLNLARSQLASLQAAITGLRDGGYVQILNLPAWMPPGNAGQLAWGWAEALGGYYWLLSVNAVPEAPYEVAVYGTFRYGTAGSQLQASATSAATLLQVQTTAGNLWTTSAADFPFNVMIGGEEMTVMNIDGAPPNFLTGQSAGFDGGLGNWVNGANVAISAVTSPVHSGTGALKASSLAAGTMSFSSCPSASITSLGLPCSAGDTIAVGGWFMAAATARTCQPGASFYTSGGVVIGGILAVTGAADTTTGWTKISGTVTAPGTAAYCRLQPQVLSTGGASEVHYMDDAYLADVTTGAALVQSFTAARSVNGVVKAQSSGTAVSLYAPPVYGLAGNH